jgi:hypothetical protein
MQRVPENLRFCERQIERLQGLRFFGVLEDYALKELREALLAAADQKEVQTIIDYWLRSNTSCPTPADLRAIARNIHESIGPAPKGCERCASFGGFVPCEGIRTTGVFAGQTYSGMVPCDCALGQFKREANKRRRELEATLEPTPGRDS